MQVGKQASINDRRVGAEQCSVVVYVPFHRKTVAGVTRMKTS